MSDHFRNSLYEACKESSLSTIKRWWQTVDGIVLPLLLTAPDPDQEYTTIDQLVKFGFENCANNYSRFISRMKTLKRLLRKDYATDSHQSADMFDVRTYLNAYRRYYPAKRTCPNDIVQYILVWAQTRASGLADSRMIQESLDKMETTISTLKRPTRMGTLEFALSGSPKPYNEPILPVEILYRTCDRIARKIDGSTCHVSAGPNACIESSRRDGGQTGYIFRLARHRVVRRTYDFASLVPTECEPRPVRSVQDLVSWSIDMALNHRAYVSCVRLRAVPEPSKARAITVCSLPYLVIVGVLSKILQPALSSDITRTGLRGTRNLWELLYTDLEPSGSLWGVLRDEGKVAARPMRESISPPITAMCSDLSEATDFGDLGVARQVLHALLSTCAHLEGFPLGLCLLAKTLFLGKRFVFRENEGQYRYFVKRSGWLMGDRLTKVILTLSHEIVLRVCQIPCARICGDDVVALSRDREKLERYYQLVHEYGFKVSDEDHFLSSKLMFYCEEGAVPPQAFSDLPSVGIRRCSRHCYVDYPRIRLMIPTRVETNPYSYTDLGRFSLLGKECRWAHQAGSTRSQRLFHLAGLLQHLMVPAPSDVICPYLPLEIGGDGGFPPSGEFLFKVVDAKCRPGAFDEVHFRMHQMLTGKWSYRLVRSNTLNDVVHKYHLLVPKLNELRSLLPEEAVIAGDDCLLSSIRVPGLESPEKVFFRIARAKYWLSIFRGIWPADLDLSGDRHHQHGKSHIVADCDEFFRVWKELGFVHKDTPGYLVKTSAIHVLDYMNLGFRFGRLPGEPGPPPIQEALSLNEDTIENFFEHLIRGSAADPKVQSRLHMYVNADDYLKREVSGWDSFPALILLVSGDRKLALEIVRIAQNRSSCFGGTGSIVWVINPMYYMYGLMGEFERFAQTWIGGRPWDFRIVRSFRTLVDFGAVAYSAFVNAPTFEWPVDGSVVLLRPYRGRDIHRVYDASLEAVGATESCSLTTQAPSQYQSWRNKAGYRTSD